MIQDCDELPMVSMVVIMCELNSQFVRRVDVRVMCRATCEHIPN
jgi:hypothetical protein